MNTLNRVEVKRLVATAAVIGVASFASACGTQGAASTARPSGPEATAVAVEASQARELRIALAEEVVRNGKYELPGIGSFQLKDGTYQERYGEGATQVKRVGVVAVAFGDLDGDKVEDAAVVLWANTGGTGTFIYLTPVLNRGGKGEQAGAELLGDRVEIKSLAVSSGRVRVELLAQGASDPMVSPSLQTVREYALQAGKLVGLTPPDPTAQPAARSTQQPTATPAPRAAGSGPIGTIWIWDRFVAGDEKGSFILPYPAAYRLELLAGGEYSVQADCNRGGGTYALDGSRLALSAGPVTLAECRSGSRSSQFVDMLGQVAAYVMKGETLHLNLKADGGDMVFSRLNSVTGRIAGPPGAAVPAGSTAEVTLASASGAQIGGAIVRAELPMEFEVPFKPASIDPSAGYSVEVTIRDAQKNALYKSSGSYPVLTRGNATYHLQIEVSRVGAEGEIGGVWERLAVTGG